MGAVKAILLGFVLTISVGELLTSPIIYEEC